MADAPLAPTRTPRPGVPRPTVAWPTVLLAVALATLWVGAAGGYLTGRLSAWAAVPLLALAGFGMFTVLHDATHRGLGKVRWVNEALGRVAIPFVLIYASFPLFRFIHLEHHKHVNEDPDTDPDAWVIEGPTWQLPLRWAVVDLRYLWFYLRAVPQRPSREVAGVVAVMVTTIGGLVALSLAGYGTEVLVLVLLPQRLQLTWLAFWFDWLPHHGLEATNRDSRLHTTRNVVGGEWFLTPLLFSQNYHLVHHIHPIVPFYRYVQAWRHGEEDYLAAEPHLVSPTGRPVSADEERARRGLTTTV